MTDAQLLATLDQRLILALTMLREAGGDRREGLSSVEERIGVGCVVRNRVRDGRWPRTYRWVCLQPKQFSCWDQGNPNRPVLLALAQRLVTDPFDMDEILRETAFLATGILGGQILDATKGANHYLHRRKVASVPWDDTMRLVGQIGDHVFFVG